MGPHLTSTALLRPGARLLRRDPDHLQLGLDPAHAVVVRDTPEHRGLLAAWNRGDLLELLATHPLGQRLAAAGLVVVPNGCDRSTDRYADAARLLAGADPGRATTPGIRLETFGGEPGERVAGRLRALLAESGCPLLDDPSADGARDGLIVLAGIGQPARERLDPWVREAVPHLVVRLDEGCATVGPFVVPGQTACLRCVDAHRTEQDPRWALLVAQHAQFEGRDRPDGVPEPVDPALTALATGWAARDVLAWRSGTTPSTWSTTLRLTPDSPDLLTQAWTRHPGCGCGWELSATMAT